MKIHDYGAWYWSIVYIVIALCKVWSVNLLCAGRLTCFLLRCNFPYGRYGRLQHHMSSQNSVLLEDELKICICFFNRRRTRCRRQNLLNRRLWRRCRQVRVWGWWGRHFHLLRLLRGRLQRLRTNRFVWRTRNKWANSLCLFHFLV